MNIFHHPSAFIAKHKRHHHLMLATLALIVASAGVYTYRHEFASAATFTFNQTSWGGGLTANTANHASNQSGWTQYTATSSTSVLASAGGVSLQSTNKTAVDDGVGISAKTDYTTTNSPWGVAVSPDGTSAYTANSGSSNISMFVRNTSTGVLSGRVDYGTGLTPYGVAISPDGTSVYVANYGTTTISMFARNTSNGTLSTKTDYTAGTNPYAVAISPDGTSVYVANDTSGNVSMFTRNTSNGTLSTKTDYPAGSLPRGIAVSPDGASVYTANAGAGTVSMFARNTSNGTLSTKTDSTASGNPYGVAISPDGTSVYVGDANILVSRFIRATSTGALTSRIDYTTGGSTYAVAISPDGTSVYASTFNNVVSMFTRNTSNGTLSIKTDYTTTGTSHGVTVSPDGNSVYVVNSNGTNVSMFARAAKGGALGFESGTYSSTVQTGTSTAASVGLGTNWLATGGATSTSGGYFVHTFTSNGTFAPASNIANAEYLVVGGGGGGAAAGITKYSGGGGGAGGMLFGTTAINSGSYSVSIGAGGAATTGNATSTGGYSVLNLPTPIVAIGGGSGGANYSGARYGSDGGSGGGGGSLGPGLATTTPVQGYNGTIGCSQYCAGGGGGAGGVAGNADLINSYGGPGGVGLQWPTGSGVYYAGGGGGGAQGVGKGGAATSTQGGGGPGGGNLVAGTAGINGTGGGGGGGWGAGMSASGGSGIVIVRYPSTYTTSGTFTSAVINLGAKIASSPAPTLAWANTLPASTTIAMQVQTSADNVTWGGYSSITSGGSITVPGVGVQYVQYKATLTTTDTAVTPTLDSVTINYSQYTASGNLISSMYDSGSSANLVSNISWAASNTDVDETVMFQVRSASTTALLATAPWCGQADCSGNTYFTTTGTSNATLSAATNDHEWFQYKVFLASGGDITPTLTSATVQYVVNAPPTVSNVTAVQNANGTVTVGYGVTDDTNASVAITLQYCTTNCTPGSEVWADAVTVSGNVGASVATSTSRSITWTPTTDYSAQNKASQEVRIKADDGETANRYGYGTSGTFTLNTIVAVTSVTAVQNADGTVTAGYATAEASSTSGYTTDITLQYCTTNCTPGSEVWADAVTVSGNVGASVAVGTGKSVTWTPTTDYSAQYKLNTQEIRIKANDHTVTSNIGYGTSTAFTLDTTVPVVVANLNSSGAQDIVNITATDSSTLTYRLCNSACTTETWTAITSGALTPVNWSAVGAPGAETVYLQVKDAYSNQTLPTIVAPATLGSFLAADVSNPTAGYYGEALSWVSAPGFTTGWTYKVYSATSTTAAGPAGAYSLINSPPTNSYTHIISSNTNLFYWYKVVVVNVNGDISNFTPSMTQGDLPDGFGTSAPDVIAPTISNIATSSILNTSARVTFTTSELATSTVTYYTGAAQGANCTGTSQVTTSFATAQSVTLTGLTANTAYGFCVNAGDTSGNVSAKVDGGSFTTATGPIITGIASTTAATSATINWTTANISSDSYVSYSTDALLANFIKKGSATLVGTSTGAHSVTIDNLLTAIKYYFSISSTDGSGNITTDPSPLAPPYRTFTTGAPPIISNIATSSILSTSATVTFTTNQLATSTVMYGTTFSPTCAYASTTLATSFATAQSITLTGLTASTTYSFCVNASNSAGNVSASVDGGSFTTSSGPAITGVASSTTQTSALVSWFTATPADSYVSYTTSSAFINPVINGSATPLVTSHAVSIPGLATSTKYYFSLKSTDTNGNIATDTNGGNYYSFTTGTPTAPSFTSGPSASAIATSSAVIVWQTNALATSRLMYGTTTMSYTKQTATDTVESIYHVVTLDVTTLNAAGGATNVLLSNNALTPDTTYYYIAESSINPITSANTATSSEKTLTTLSPGVSTGVPVISSIATSSVLSTSAVVSFTTSVLATSTVMYGTTYLPNCAYTSSTSDSAFSVQHQISLSGLATTTMYYFCVRASDANVPPHTSVPTPTDGGSFLTISGPGIIDHPLGLGTDTTATIQWTTNTSSDSYVTYSLNSNLSASNRVGISTYTTTKNGQNNYVHLVTLTGLTPGKRYYYQVESTDANDTTVDKADSANFGNYYHFDTIFDTTPPVITGISTPVLAPDAAVIVWQTNELANSQVMWGTASTYGRSTVTDNTKSIYHIVTLSSATNDMASLPQTLTPETTYHFAVYSSDLVAPPGNATTSVDQSFTTPKTGNVTVTTINVVNSAGNTIKDIIPPTISNVKVADITPFGATVKFDTSEDTDAFVEYGKDISYGDSAGDKAYGTTHTVKLRGLTLGTDYHIKVSANDKAGNTGTSADQTFKTTFLSENLKDMANVENIEQFQKEIESAIESILPSLVPPFVTKPVISDITESSATISFKTNIKAFPVVVYAEDGAYDETKENPYIGEVSDTTTKDVSHTLALTGLKGNTKYHVQARGFSLPKVIGKSADVTFITKASKIAGSIVERKKDSFTVVWTTDEPTSSIVEYKNVKTGLTERKTDDAKKTSHSMKIENLPSGTLYEVNISGINEQGNTLEAGSPLSVTTSTDTTPPTISGFKVDNALVPGRTDRIQTIVSWMTDEPANSTVYYEEGAGTAGETKELANKNETLDSYTTNHSTILPSLKPGTIYRLKVTSSDDSGNLGSFGPRTVITPKQTESITDIIFKNFEDSFKFMRKI